MRAVPKELLLIIFCTEVLQPMLTGCSKGLFEVFLSHLPEAATGVEVVARNKVRGESGS